MSSLFLRYSYYFLIALIAGVLFIPFLGGVHLFDWDEINFAESAREMMVTGNYSRVTIDFLPFWEKPPLFFWMQVVSMKLFGVNEFAARFPNAICGVITLSLIFFIGKKYFDKIFAWFWVMAYAGSLLPHFYFKSGIIDPWFNLFIFCGIIFLIAAFETDTTSALHFILAGVFTGLGILVKGPVALIILCFTALIFFIRNKKSLSLKSTFLFFISLFVVSALWFGRDIWENGTWFIKEFIRYQIQLFGTGVASHGGPFYYHFIVLLVGCFPASIIALSGFFNRHDANSKQLSFRSWMMILFWVVLILFSIVKTKIVHYSSLCYVPLTFLAAWEIYHRIKLGVKFSKWQVALLLLTGILISIAVSSFPYIGRHPEFIVQYIKDPFAKAALAAEVHWPLYLMGFGFIYWLLFQVCIFWMNAGFLKKGVITLFILTCLLTQALLYSFVPRIELYSQGAAIDFYKSLQGKDAYVEVLGFKSYAHLFYTQKAPQQNPKSHDKNWLLNGDIDKPAYFVCKVNREDEYKSLPQLEEIGRKNGFVFFKREPSQAFR